MKHIPNIITCIRILLIPVFCYYLWNDNAVVAGIVFIVASLSDVLDGYLSRKLNAVSNFGKLADPFADKVMQISAIILLVLLNRMSTWIMIVIFVKDFILIAGGLLIKFIFKITVTSRWFGKISAFYLNAVLAVSILFGMSRNVINILMIIALVMQVASLIGYATLSLIEIKKINKEKGAV
ncbi:MAG TPA: CDP-alcohol phosphatidyltransferase family protein [Clostridia bacterium]|jgi:cardiolipin synthase|nr:CDP-diacylglycerol--glycerol-3-phosphate 3-phosphatidyltransferase [Clostridiaceae bacterium]HOF25927.1 CDP-alcohol phosphatidyltransferase family protein [Clostridia bacterium]HOM33630.1 CDP-alcohol phosphatidyltransferase family protein [Clostridia bacterium]HOR88952.1 CDP-alcohol phosphatidyltransferase family protein [Clostridia bacterium]HOT71333.1 CDP-alcohol phosphatidyltransferase family protein [Clostridia bacterium]